MPAHKQAPTRRRVRYWPPPVKPSQPKTIELTDFSSKRIAATQLFPSALRARDPATLAARLSAQFITRNTPLIESIGASIRQHFNGSAVTLEIDATSSIGAIPLISPTTGQPEYGLIIKPRFEWRGLGPMLGDMGWRVIPKILALPMLPQSERRIPEWVISSVVLFRIEAMLREVERRFEMVEEVRSAPRGSVNWAAYATQHMPRAQFLGVPSRFPDLRDDRELKSAIRFALTKQLRGLEGQRTHGVFVGRLIDKCRSLLEQVEHVPPREPSPREFERWLRGPLRTDAFRDGLQAVEWTVDDRGLAGLSDLQGLPWVMPMEEFFEAWVETLAGSVARRIGGTLRTGRQHQTTVPIAWQPAFLGSQKSLVPDVIWERGDTTFIIDAKYKEHWEELSDRRWRNLDEELRERHRTDLLQVLAYANLAKTTRVVVCLAYPCSVGTWTRLKEQGRLFYRASIPAHDRRLEVILSAFPMGERLDLVADELSREFTQDMLS